MKISGVGLIPGFESTWQYIFFILYLFGSSYAFINEIIVIPTVNGFLVGELLAWFGVVISGWLTYYYVKDSYINKKQKTV